MRNHSGGMCFMGWINQLRSRYLRFVLCSRLLSSGGTTNHQSSYINLYSRMRRAGVSVDRFTIPSVLKTCGKLSNLLLGEEVHGFAFKSGMDCDIFVLNSLIFSYSECGNLEYARKVFDSIPERDAVTWSTMIRSCCKHRLLREGLHLIRQMAKANVKPSEGGLICIINLAADIQDAELGKEIHSYAIKNNNTKNMSPRLASSLIDMYVSYTSMIASCVRNKNTQKAEALFVQMMNQRFFPNEITMTSLFIACGISQSLNLGKKVHAFHLESAFRSSSKTSAALIEMYGKCGDIRSARKVFNTVKNHDVSTWTSMISSYCLWGLNSEAFKLFDSMAEARVRPNGVTLVSLVSLCAEMGALEKGKWVHSLIKKEQISGDLTVRTSLVDMYAKCGEIEEARRLFEEAGDGDTCMWNAMINGCGINGLATEALEYFDEMRRRSVKVNHVTFLGVLTACAHSGRVEEGKRYFNEMLSGFGLVPRVDHYGCMVDLYGRAGLLEEAYGMISAMPTSPNVSVWGAFLAACRVHNNPEMAEVAGKQVGRNSFGYGVLMANVYAAEKRWNDVALVRKEMKSAGMRKAPGFSAVEIDGSMRMFVMGDTVDLHVAEICEMLCNKSHCFVDL